MCSSKGFLFLWTCLPLSVQFWKFSFMSVFSWHCHDYLYVLKLFKIFTFHEQLTLGKSQKLHGPKSNTEGGWGHTTGFFTASSLDGTQQQSSSFFLNPTHKNTWERTSWTNSEGSKNNRVCVSKGQENIFRGDT